MVNQVVMETLKEMLHECGAREQQCQREVDRCLREADSKRDVVRQVRVRKEQVDFADNEVVQKIGQLTSYYSGPVEKPAVSLHKIDQLHAEQGETFRKREEARHAVEDAERELGEAESRVRFAQQKHREAQEEWRQINDEIIRANKGV